MALYIIESRNDKPGATGQVPWASDWIGENEPRSFTQCAEEIQAFERGDCGLGLQEFYSDPQNYRIVEVE